MNDAEYYRLRESGTGFGTRGTEGFSVAIAIGKEACQSATGQSLALNLVNILLRFVNRATILLAKGDSDLLVKFPYTAPSFEETIRSIWRHCDPRALVTFGTLTTQPPIIISSADYSIGIGSDIPTGCDLYLSSEGFIGHACRSPAPISASPQTLVGSGVAALLGAANVARKLSGIDPFPVRLSGWNFAEDDKADRGPTDWPTLDVGTVRMIGAGAVASALAYWLFQWGVSGTWQIIDPDVIKLKNVAKSLAFSTSEAAEISPPGVKKVHVLERLLPCSLGQDVWYADWDRSLAPLPDVILPLANERGIRASIANDSATLVLHATTSTRWQSSVHRHIAGSDDCIACRFPDTTPAAMKCSTGSVADASSPTKTRDASLPFVAGGSGLMLAVLLQRLQLGQLERLPWNYCTWHWRTERQFTSTGTYSCRSGCASFLPRAVRRTINAKGRWAHLD